MNYGWRIEGHYAFVKKGTGEILGGDVCNKLGTLRTRFTSIFGDDALARAIAFGRHDLVQIDFKSREVKTIPNPEWKRTSLPSGTFLLSTSAACPSLCPLVVMMQKDGVQYALACRVIHKDKTSTIDLAQISQKPRKKPEVIFNMVEDFKLD